MCNTFFTNTVLTPVVYGVDVVRPAESNYFMCGIAGFSLSSDSPIDRTLAAQALLAGIAERGADAVGYAHRGADGSVGVTKLLGGASALLDEIDVPASASQALIHVRDHTKGPPEIDANNHPIRHGCVVGIHNGVVENDDALLAEYGIDRAEPQMTVDSEAIFALMELRRHDPRTLSQLRGAMAAAWLDERDDATLFLARGRLRPLWLGRTTDGLLFASTRRALAVAAAALKTRLDVREVREGRLLLVVDGRVVRERRFRPDRRYRENGYRPPVRAPLEAVSCLERLAAITAASASPA
jgi:glutamine phosphoribosylpyrophosphate amidotransferase